MLTFILAATRAKCGATGFQCRNQMWTRSEINVDEKWNFSVPTFIKQLPLKAWPAFLPRSFRQPMWTKSGRNVDEKWTKSGNKVARMWTKCGKKVAALCGTFLLLEAVSVPSSLQADHGHKQVQTIHFSKPPYSKTPVCRALTCDQFE